MFTVEFKIFGNNVKSLKYVVILLICIIVREKCPYSQFIWSLFFRIRTEYREMPSISPYSVQMRENTGQK